MKTDVSAALILVVAFAGQAVAQTKRGLVWDDRPTIVFGEDVTIGIRGKLQLDWRTFDPDINEETYDFRSGRVGLKGDLTKHFDYELEREMEPDGLGDWKDVYLNWATFDAIRIKGGHFKMPFGLEQNTGSTDLDFAHRALGSSAIAPARDRGVMVYGDLGRVGYEVGVFDDDGDNAELREPQFVEEGQDLKGVGPSFAARITGDLFRLLPVPDRLKSANFGVAFTSASIPEGLNSLRGEGTWGDDYFEPVYVKGRRQRLGFQFDWTPGPVGVKAEWMQSREQRLGQSNRNEDLSDFIGTGWYVSGTWFVTGEDKDENINPRKPLFRGGIGAIELVARYDQLGFRSASTEGPAFTNPRADHLLPNTDQVWTFGFNWMFNRWVRVMTNGIHETFDDASRSPESGIDKFWSGLIRLQVAF